jgi:hypothetical protein
LFARERKLALLLLQVLHGKVLKDEIERARKRQEKTNKAGDGERAR